MDDLAPAIDKETETRYATWKKNAPYFYDYVQTHSLVWPSISVQFLPDIETQAGDPTVTLQRLVVGTFTSGIGTDSISIYQLPQYKNLNQQLNVDSLKYNPDKREFEVGVPSKPLALLQKINHVGDVNKLRYMPQNPDVIASANNMGDLVVYDRTKHSNTIATLTPQLRLAHNSHVDIFAVDWNRQREACIVAADTDGAVLIFDIKNSYKAKADSTLAPISTFTNPSGINDVEWVPSHDSLFYFSDDSGVFQLFDTRSNTPTLRHQPSSAAINSLSVNPATQTCIATGNDQGVVSVWDIRALGSSITINAHTESVLQLKWHPRFPSVLGSCSTDRLAKIIDVHQEKPIFSHEGHMLGVNDFDWSLHDEWLVASVSDDNSLHVWRPSHHVVAGDR